MGVNGDNVGADDNNDAGTITAIDEDGDDGKDDVNNEIQKKIMNDFFYYSNRFSINS